jgi:hypothetical protein
MIGPIFMAFLASAASYFQPAGDPVVEDKPDAALAALAGAYYFGDGLGVNCSLTLTREARFSFVSHGCMGEFDRKQGTAKLVAGHLILTPERPNEREGFGGLATDLIPVRWGERQYLVTEGSKKAFCNGVNIGLMSATSHAYLRREDKGKKVTGLPIVPKEWEQFLLKKPLEGKIIEVFDGSPARAFYGLGGPARLLGNVMDAFESPAQARVDLGTVNGVWKGMDLWVEAPFGSVKVIEVDEKTCLVTLGRREWNALRKGQVVKSQFFSELRDMNH